VAGTRRRRWLVRLAVALVTVAVLVTVTGVGLYQYYQHRITHVGLSFPPDYQRPAALAGSVNYLLIGSDSREGTGGQYNSSGLSSGQNSDTQILAHLDANGSATLVSFPRDTDVSIPAYLDGTGIRHPASHNRMNAAFHLGGPSLLIQTVESLTRIRVDHFIEVDLAGFKQITDAVGGIDVCLKASPTAETGLDDLGHPFRATNLDDPFTGFHGHPGTLHLDGEQALAFVRQRHGLPNGDLDRIKRQQLFLAAAYRQATASSVLLDPARVLPLLNAATGALTTDTGTGLNDLRGLLERLHALDAGRIHLQTVPTHWPTAADGADSRGLIHGMSVLIYDRAGADAMLTPLRGSPTPAPAAPPTPATPSSPTQSQTNTPGRPAATRPPPAGDLTVAADQCSY
jgi:LCP family protein required for cell wall assembly